MRLTSLSSAFLIVMLTGVVILPGCSQTAPVDPNANQPPPAAEDLKHTVMYYGETLGLIAKWYTGDTNNWRTIQEFNPGLRPEAMRLGDVIVIPGELLNSRDPLPEQVVKKFSGVSAAPVAKKNTETAVKVENESENEVDEMEAIAESAEPEVVEVDVPSEKSPEDELLDDLLADDEPVMVEQEAASQAVETEVAEEKQEAEGATAEPLDKEREELLDELLAN